MNTKTLRNLIFPLHRYVGLMVALLLIVVGLTGTLLVFQHEIDHWLMHHQFGQVIAQEQRVAIASVIDAVKVAYANRPDLTLTSITTLPTDDVYKVWFKTAADERLQVIVNPYTGEILGDRQWEQTLIGFTFLLHYQLLAGKPGEIIVGIVALLLFILCITGIVLWSGWRKLISGFKIKWNAHPKRVNFDIHKVAGIVSVVFLTFIAFTGFCWNFNEFTYPVIHAVTFSPKPPTPVSKPLPDRAPLPLSTLLQKADAVLPGAATTYISLPTTPESSVRVGKKLPQEAEEYGRSRVYLDQYTGDVVQLQNGLKPSRADRVFNAFVPLHYGTFGGLPSRLLYLFVGMAPMILAITGFVMWWYRYRKKQPHPDMARSQTTAKHL